MALTGNKIFVDGVRVLSPDSLDEAFEARRRLTGTSWIGLHKPDPAELEAVAREFSLPALFVDDARLGHPRAKLGHFESTLLAVLRPARYVEDGNRVRFSELHVFLGPDFIITVQQDNFPDLDQVFQALEANPHLLRQGPLAAFTGILDRVTTDYEPVLAGMHDQLDGPESNPVVRHRLRHVQDLAVRQKQQAQAFRSLLQNALSLSATLAAERMTETSVRQNEQVKRISAWAAILFAPTLVGTVYGMNFRFMPELHWLWGYPLALLLMLAMSLGLYVAFRRNRWL
ncbi:CorA family divalent cation transporter [Arthrobacter sp. Marseille-P9274]|uniref:CorA family divalent cation transporter n=1 Tax=Arthrobacter sp. Marseille-P9274 TaxID=2866572 RepID=UPI0021C88F42|nr:CorA family divalent cation transporter [Arthrobacter sp. Marseille-P9274]